MKLIDKIAQEEVEIVKRAYKRWATCPYTNKRSGVHIPGKTKSGFDEINHPLIAYLKAPYWWNDNDEDRNKMLLNLELKSLREYSIITEKERRKYARMVRREGDMRNLASVIINNYRNKRIKKYGYANVKL